MAQQILLCTARAEVQGCNNRTCDGPECKPDMARASYTAHYPHGSLPSLHLVTHLFAFKSLNHFQYFYWGIAEVQVHITRHFWCQDSCPHCDWLWQFLLFWMHQIARAQCSSPQTQAWNPRRITNSWSPGASSSTHRIFIAFDNYTDTVQAKNLGVQVARMCHELHSVQLEEILP